jgi:flavin reductase (DIM6/NTAB) family NADH-FMN oxidoreductase RutF
MGDDDMTVESPKLRAALGQFPTGVVIVTALTPGGERIGMTMNSFSSVSLEPPLVLFSINRRALSYPKWQTVSRYAINVLNDEQEKLSIQFAHSEGDKWNGVELASERYGVPILPTALISFECEAYARYDGGDHEIFIGRVVRIYEGNANRRHPLVFFEGRYRQLARDRANATEAPDLQGLGSGLYSW